MYLSKVPLDITVIYYTSNYLEKENPYFVSNTKKQLIKAIDGLPLISVSHQPMDFGQNIVVGEKDGLENGRSHRNIYRQILIGCKAAKTKYVAMAEDDILYSHAHFHTYVPKEDSFAYDMQKLSVFTWTKPPVYSFRTKRMVVNQLIAPREMLIEALEERFARVEELKELGWDDDKINSRWGDPGRYENLLGVSPRKKEEFFSSVPSIVFTHPKAFGYETNHGKKKLLGDVRMYDIPEWGRAEDILKLHNEPVIELVSKVKPDENSTIAIYKTIKEKNKQKDLWEKLAKENSRYYINSDHGKGINEEQFKASGFDDYIELIDKDVLLKKKGIFLEIGCGSGRMTEYISTGWPSTIGTDISGEMIRTARERVKGVHFLETDGYTFPLPENHVDIAFSHLVFQHMKTKEMVESNFIDVYRVLKPDGIFKVRIRTDHIKHMQKWWAGVAYTEQSIGNVARTAGFEIIKTEAVEDYGLWIWLRKPLNIQ